MKTYLKQVVVSVLFWALCLTCFAIFRYLGIDRITEIEVNVNSKSLLAKNMIVMAIIGTMLGLVYASVDFFFNRYIAKSISLGAAILSRIFIYFVSTVLLLRMR